MSFITVAAGQPIRSTHINQFTRWITGQTKDTPLTLTTTSATDYTATFTNEDTSAGLIAKFTYGNTTVGLINKTGVTFNVPIVATGVLAGLFTQTGQVIYGSGGTGAATLNIGATYQSLQVSTGGTPAWAASPASTLTAQGDLLGASAANTITRIPKGTAFQDFVMNGGATGQTWATGFLASVQAAGDVIYGGGANTASRLALGAAGTFLQAQSGGTLTWGTPGAAAQSIRSPIVNGDFNVWQRGASFASMATIQALADCWTYSKNLGTGIHDGSRSTDVPAVASSVPLQNYSILVDCKTTEAAIAAGEYCFITHSIEGYDWLPFAQHTSFTLSFWVQATKAGTYCVAFRNSVPDRSYVAEYTVASSATWEQKSVTVPASPSGGTWDYASGIGLRVSFTLAGGSTFQATPGAWTTGHFFSTSNQVNAIDDTGNDFRIAQVQIDKGTSASQFAPASIAESLARCQRYVYVVNREGSKKDQVAAGHAFSATNAITTFTLPVTMRTTPTLTLSGSTANDLVVVAGGSSLSASAGTALSVISATSNPDRLRLDTTVSGATTGQGCFLQVDATSLRLIFSADL